MGLNYSILIIPAILGGLTVGVMLIVASRRLRKFGPVWAARIMFVKGLVTLVLPLIVLGSPLSAMLGGLYDYIYAVIEIVDLFIAPLAEGIISLLFGVGLWRLAKHARRWRDRLQVYQDLEG